MTRQTSTSGLESGPLEGVRCLPGEGTSGSHSGNGSSIGWAGHLEGSKKISSFGGNGLAHLRIRSQPPSPPALPGGVPDCVRGTWGTHLSAPVVENCSFGGAELQELILGARVSDPDSHMLGIKMEHF